MAADIMAAERAKKASAAQTVQAATHAAAKTVQASAHPAAATVEASPQHVAALSAEAAHAAQTVDASAAAPIGQHVQNPVTNRTMLGVALEQAPPVVQQPNVDPTFSHSIAGLPSPRRKKRRVGVLLAIVFLLIALAALAALGALFFFNKAGPEASLLSSQEGYYLQVELPELDGEKVRFGKQESKSKKMALPNFWSRQKKFTLAKMNSN